MPLIPEFVEAGHTDLGEFKANLVSPASSVTVGKLEFTHSKLQVSLSKAGHT